jgi:late competence protein required for DNA uptake (superfamily II DNA/RNA helicase)
LTDVAEGTIVRVITRLDETCREVRDAARVIGDADLFKKMEESQIKIKRDSTCHRFRNSYFAQIAFSRCSCFRCQSVFLSERVCIASNLHYLKYGRQQGAVRLQWVSALKWDDDAYVPKAVVEVQL